MLLQKFPAPSFKATMKLKFAPIAKYKGERTGLVVMGMDYAGIILENTESGLVLSQVECKKADRGGTETVNASVPLKENEIYLRAEIISTGEKISKSEGGHDLVVMCQMSYSTKWKEIPEIRQTFPSKRRQMDRCQGGYFLHPSCYRHQ